jgi:molecular chaperone GrpE
MENQPNEQENVAIDEKAQIEALQKELQEYKDKYFRTLAETENMRKRLQKEKIDSQSFAVQGVVCDFLQPLDHLEQALKASENAQNEIKNWAKGFQMILAQCQQILQDHGAVPFDSLGKAFDPHMHEAIETEESSDAPEGTVVQEFARGYKMASRIIRPAKVKVTVAKASANGQTENTQV